jgi:hypothetical protein
VVTDDLLNVLTALRRAGHPVTLVETSGSRRNAGQHASPDGLRSQGIIYYLVEALDGASTLNGISL